MTSPRQVLYLEGDGATKVIRDGPALCVRARGKAEVRFPLRRIRRVVAMGRVEWSCDALMFCARGGIPVCFTTRSGSHRAVLTGTQQARAMPTMRMLEDYLGALAGNLEPHRSWVRAMVRNAQVKCARKVGFFFDKFEGEVLKRFLTARAKRYVCSTDARMFISRIEGFLKADARCRLESDIGIGLEADMFLARNVDLAHDFASVLIWTLYPECLRYLKQRYGLARRRREMLASLTLKNAPEFYDACDGIVAEAFGNLWQAYHLHLLASLNDHEH